MEPAEEVKLVAGPPLNENPLLIYNGDAKYALRDPSIVKSLLKISNPAILAGFDANKELRGDSAINIVVLNLLPMPMYRSPVLIMYKFNKNDAWVSGYISSIQQVTLLQRIRLNLITLHNRQDVQEFYVLQLRAKEQRFVQMLRESVRTLGDFVTLMRNWTLEIVRLLEATIYRALKMQVPLLHFMSPTLPMECPPAIAEIVTKEWVAYLTSLEVLHETNGIYFGSDPGPYMSSRTLEQYWRFLVGDEIFKAQRAR